MNEAGIKELVQQLNRLHEGERALARLILAGPASIPHLAAFLMLGPPSSVYQPRRWAVEGLGALGAKDALIAYLRAEHDVTDPLVKAGEEAVRNAAARELMRWPAPDVFEVLMEVARHQLTSGIVEAIGSFNSVEAIPLLDRALEDGVLRAAAEDAFRRLGRQASAALVLSATTPLPNAAEETSSSLARRISAVRLLSEIGADPQDWPALEPLLSESDPRLVTAAALVAMRAAPPSGQADAGRAVIRTLPAAPWDVRMEAGDLLAALLPQLREEIEAEVRSRRQSPRMPFDPVLPVLLHALRSAGSG